MRTIQDLEAAFARLADTAPGPDVLHLPDVQKARMLTTRRRFAPVAAALVTAAAAVGIALTVLPDGASDEAAAPTLTALPYPAEQGSIDPEIHFTADAPADTATVRRYSVDRGEQQLTFNTPPPGRRCPQTGVVAGRATYPRRNLLQILPDVDPGCRLVASVSLYYAGRATGPDAAFDPNDIPDRQPQDIAGKPGFFGTPQNLSSLVSPVSGSGTLVHLYWQYARGAWAEAVAPSRKAALTLAQSVRPAAKLLTVPAQLRPLRHQYLNTIDSETSPAGGSFDITSKNAEHGLATVSWGTPGVSTAEPPVTDEHTVTVGNRRWSFGNHNGQAQARLLDSPLPVHVDGFVGMSRDALAAIVARVHLAPDLADRSTWFGANTLQ